MAFQRPNYFGSQPGGGLLVSSQNQINQARNSAQNFVPSMPTQPQAASPALNQSWDFLKTVHPKDMGILGLLALSDPNSVSAGQQGALQKLYTPYQQSGGGLNQQDWFNLMYQPANRWQYSMG